MWAEPTAIRITSPKPDRVDEQSPQRHVRESREAAVGVKIVVAWASFYWLDHRDGSRSWQSDRHSSAPASAAGPGRRGRKCTAADLAESTAGDPRLPCVALVDRRATRRWGRRPARTRRGPGRSSSATAGTTRARLSIASIQAALPGLPGFSRTSAVGVQSRAAPAQRPGRRCCASA